MTPELHYFRCRFCQSVLVTTIKSSRPEQCRCSGSWMRYSHSVPVTTEEEKAIHRQGRVWNPHRLPAQPWTCGRCGEQTTDLAHVRADGPCCDKCYHAETVPKALRTPEEIEARQRERAEFRRAMEDQHERAFQQREEEHNTQ